MYKSTILSAVKQAFMIPFVTVSVIFWSLTITIRGIRITAMYLEEHLPEWQTKAEEAVTAATLTTIHMGAVVVGEAAGLWKFRNEIIEEWKESTAAAI